MKQKQKMLVITIVALILLPILVLATKQITGITPKAATLPLDSVRVSPGQIVTDMKGTTVYLSALAYDSNGSPISTGIFYQWGFSTTNSIGIFTPNGTTNLASFTPSKTITGRGDIWVKAYDTSGKTTMKSVPVYVGIVPEVVLLDSVRINPEQINTVRNAPSVSLSALAYKNGAPVWSGISYEWGISSMNSIGRIITNGSANIASFEPSHVATGTGDLWVKASDEGGHVALRSIPITVGYQSVPTPTITTPTKIPTGPPTPIVISSTPVPPTSILCPKEDINKDGMVDGQDRAIILANFLSTTPTNGRADVNNDGIVDITDYSLVVKEYGRITGTCQ